MGGGGRGGRGASQAALGLGPEPAATPSMWRREAGGGPRAGGDSHPARRASNRRGAGPAEGSGYRAEGSGYPAPAARTRRSLPPLPSLTLAQRAPRLSHRAAPSLPPSLARAAAGLLKPLQLPLSN